MRFFVGADPDTQHAALAAVDEDGRPFSLQIIQHQGGTGADAVVAMSKAVSLALYAEPVLGQDDPKMVAAVEGQQIDYAAKKGVRPQMLIPVAQVAGGILTALQIIGCEKAYMPLPARWKGQVPKQIHQNRIYHELGWTAVCHGSKKTGYARPTMATIPAEQVLIDKITQEHGVTAWKHLGDAIGLARWAREQFLKGK